MVDSKLIAILGVVLTAAILLGTMRYDWGLLATYFQAAPVCKSVYCNDFNYICCSEDTGGPTYVYAAPDAPCKFLGIGACDAGCTAARYAVQCPTTASRCEIQGSASAYTSCSKVTSVIGCPQWSCSGPLTELKPGTWALSATNANFQLKVYSLKLFDCGRSACAYQTSGIPLTTSGCTWVTDKRVYDASGSLIADPTGSYQFTVPAGKCYLYTTGNLRRVCGDTCEQCSVNSDCAVGHTYAYNNMGAECQSKQLLLYGCRKYDSIPLEKDVLPFGDRTIKYTTSSRCELVQTLPVGCCPDSDYCGVNAFCDPVTFTCKASGQVECTYDWQCGQAVSCDWSTRQLKQPTCALGKCTAAVVRAVDCCYDENCPSGYYCGADYKCYQQVQPKTTCPFECCEREALYVDKPCAGDKQCVNHACVGQTDDIVRQGTWALVLGSLAAALAFLSSGGIRNWKDEEYDLLGISAVYAALAGMAVWWVVSNLLALLAGSIILVALGLLAAPVIGGALITAAYVVGAVIKGLKGD